MSIPFGSGVGPHWTHDGVEAGPWCAEQRKTAHACTAERTAREDKFARDVMDNHVNSHD